MADTPEPNADNAPPDAPYCVQQAARTIAALNTMDGSLDLPAVVDDLSTIYLTTDETRVASMLAVHAHVLDAVFNRLLAAPDPYFDRTLQIGMALRAHRQCLDTLNTLTALMYPNGRES